jgi:hypothetical protein
MYVYEAGFTFPVTKGGPAQVTQHIQYETPVISAIATVRGFFA